MPYPLRSLRLIVQRTVQNDVVGLSRARIAIAAFALLAVACGGGGSEPDAVATGTWNGMSAAPIAGRSPAATQWTGKEMIVWAGGSCKANPCQFDNVDPLADGAAYDPVADAWAPIPAAPLSGRVEAGAAWTGTEMLVWGGSTHGRSVTLDDGAAYDPVSRSWTTLPGAPLEGRALHVAVTTPQGVLIWGGCCNVTPEFEDSFRDGALFVAE
jgi:hypothetical protein